MKTICKIAIVAAALVLAAVTTVQAQPYYGFQPPILFNSTGSTATNAFGNGSGTYTNTFNCQAGKELGLQLDFALASGGVTGNSNSYVAVYKSLDGRVFDGPINTIALTQFGATNVTLTTNITINSVNWVQVRVSTASAIPLTNSTLKAVVK